MAAARSGARLPILRCWAWLKLATRVAGGAGIWASSWHCRQTVFAGSRLSDALLLPAAAVWHVAHGSWRPRWSLCEKGAAYDIPHAAPHAISLTASRFTPYSSVSYTHLTLPTIYSV